MRAEAGAAAGVGLRSEQLFETHFMANPPAERQTRRHLSSALAVMLAAVVALPGCAQRVYRADRLPVELTARLPVPIDTINLSGLADRPAQTEVICPGDVLEVSILTDYNKLTTTATPVRVAGDGTVEVPLVGRVQVAGQEVEQAEQTIIAESQVRGIFRNPCITLSMKQPRTNKITIVGAVNAPGVHDLPRRSSTLLAALVAAGGLSKEAGPDVEIRHSKPPSARPLGPGGSPEGALTAHEQPAGEPAGMIVRVNLATAAQDRKAPYLLEDGDVVHVFKRELERIAVLGLVRKPGSFEFPANRPLRVLDAIALAEGTPNPVADKVVLIRRPAGKPEPVNIAVSIQKAKNGSENLELQPGDTVVVEQTPATVVVDIVQTFFRVGFSATFPTF
jgi:polysaccharide export outer membrane protein